LVWHEKGTNKAKKRYIGRNLPPVPREVERYMDRHGDVKERPGPQEVESHGMVMQLLPKGGKYNLRRVQERWQMTLSKP
jgi:hypothetical protein